MSGVPVITGTACGLVAFALIVMLEAPRGEGDMKLECIKEVFATSPP